MYCIWYFCHTNLISKLHFLLARNNRRVPYPLPSEATNFLTEQSRSQFYVKRLVFRLCVRLSHYYNQWPLRIVMNFFVNVPLIPRPSKVCYTHMVLPFFILISLNCELIDSLNVIFCSFLSRIEKLISFIN